MAKLTGRTELAAQPADGDLVHIVDVSDTTDNAAGSSRKITYANLIPDASTTVEGKVELATNAEALTGTDTARAVTPAGVKAVADTKAATSHTHAAADVNSGVLDAARIATGTPDGTKFLRDDQVWTAIPGGGDMLASTYDPQAVAGDAFDTDNHTDGTTNKVYTATEKTKLAGIETAADVTDATNVAAAGATMDADTSLAGNGYFLDEDDMVSNSATKVPSQQSVKAYVDANAGTGVVETVVAGSNIDVDATDPANPIVSVEALTPADIGLAASVTELDYVDGVTSAIQTQLDGKQASGATLTSLEGLSLVAGDILYATAADTLTRLPKGTADQVLTMNAGATAPEWETPAAGGSSTPRITFSAIDGMQYQDGSTAGNLFKNTSGTSAAVTYANSNGRWKIESGTTATTGRAQIYISQYAIALRSAANDLDLGEDPSCSIIMCYKVPGSSSDNVSWIGMHPGMNAATPSATEKHMAIQIVTVAGTTTFYASNANGTTQTATAITGFHADGTENTVDKIYIEYTSGTSIKFYVNNVLKATHTTNLPTGAIDSNGGNGYFAGLHVKNGTTPVNTILQCYQMDVSFNMY